jgi:hypothetical protein
MVEINESIAAPVETWILADIFFYVENKTMHHSLKMARMTAKFDDWFWTLDSYIFVLFMMQSCRQEALLTW